MILLIHRLSGTYAARACSSWPGTLCVDAGLSARICKPSMTLKEYTNHFVKPSQFEASVNLFILTNLEALACSSGCRIKMSINFNSQHSSNTKKKE